MTDNNSLYTEPKKPDEFRTESPLRGFAEYQEFGGYLIAKGFRPSLQHLVRYLGAMEAREGYRLIQVLEADTGVPTMIFRTTARAPLDQVADAFKPAEIERGNKEARKVAMSAALGAGYGKDPQKAVTTNTVSFYMGVPGHVEGGVEGHPKIGVFWVHAANLTAVERMCVREGFDELHMMVGDDLNPNDFNPSGFFLSHTDASGRFVYKLKRNAPWTVPDGCDWSMIGGETFIIDLSSMTNEQRDMPEQFAPEWFTFERWDGMKAIFKRKEVTSEFGEVAEVEQVFVDDKPITPAIVQNPVDVLESMAEDIAEDLGLEVDRESFEVAREHLAEMVPLELKPIPLSSDEVAFTYDAGEAIPENVYHVGGRFYNKSCDRDMGNEFRSKWIERRGEFPQTNDAHPKFDDANPAHYNGWECGDIGERLSANGYQILKYCWRLGKKDDPCKELGKALRYLDRETDYLKSAFPYNTITPIVVDIEPKERLNYLLNRTANQSQFTADVARFLWDGYTVKDLPKLKAIIADHKATLDCGHGLAL